MQSVTIKRSSGQGYQGYRRRKMAQVIVPAVAAVSAALAGAGVVHAATGTWSSATSGLWSDTSKWTGGTVADGAGSIADFSTQNLGADATVSLDSSRTIGQLKFADTTTTFSNWTLDNNGNPANVLTLDNGASQPVITVGTGTNATQITTISGVIAGTNGFIKTGPSALLLTGNNTFTGQVTLNSTTSNTGSDLILGSNNALGGLASNTLYIDPGSSNLTRVRLNAGVIIPNNITIHTTRAPLQNGVLQTNGNVSATFTGAITIDGPVSSGGHFSGPNDATLTNFLTISGPITLSALYPAANLTNANNNGVVTRTGNIILAGGGSYFRIEQRNGELRLGANNGIATNAYIDMGVNNGNPGGANATLDLYGFNQTMVGVENLSQNGTVTNSNPAGLPSTLTLTPGIAASAPTPPNLVFAGSVMSDFQPTFAGSILSVVINGSATGTQTFNNAASTYHGSTTLNSGILSVNTLAVGGAPSSIGASTSDASNLVFGGGTLRYTAGSVSTDRNFTINSGGGTIDVSTGATTLTMSGTATGAGGLTKAGAGTLVLSGAHTYAGNTTVSAGTLTVNGSLAATSNVSIASAATLAGTGTVNGTVTPAAGGTIAPAGAGLAGTLTTGALTLNTGAIVNFEFDAGNDKLTVANAGGLTLSGGSLNLYNTGTLTAFATNGTYTLFNINGGFGGTVDNLTVSNPVAGKFYNITGSATAINLIIGDATTIPWTNGNSTNLWTDSGNWTGGVIPNAVGQTASFGVASGSGTVDLNGNKTVSGLIFNNNGMNYSISGSGALTIDNGSAAGAITVSAGTHSIDVPVVLAGAMSVMTTGAGDSLGISGNISGAFPMTVSGPGSVSLTGSNSFTTMSINASTVNVGNGGAGGTLGTGNITLANAAILNFNTSSNHTYGQSITGAGAVNQIGPGTTTVGAVNVTAVNVSNGGLVASSLAQSGGINVSGSGSLTATGTISGAGQLLVNTTGVVSLNSANTYAGGTELDAGTITLNAVNALPANSALAVNGGTLDLNAKSISLTNILDNPGSTGVITNNGANGTTSTISFTGNANNYNLYAALNDGVNGGKVALVSGINNVNLGTFSLALHAASTYSGGTTITRQSIDAYATNALGSGPVVLQSNTGSTNVTHLGIAGGVTLPNDITIALPNGGTGAGAIQFLATTLGNATLTGAITVQADNFTGGTFAGPPIPGFFLNINGPVTATGGTTAISVRAGNVGLGGGGSYPEIDIFSLAVLNANNGIATNALLNVVGGGGTLDLVGFSQTATGLVGAGGVTNTSGTTGTLALNVGSDRTFTGTLDGNINLAKSGSATQTLVGTPAHTGTTSVSAGRLLIQGDLTNTSAVSVTGGTLELASDGSFLRLIRTPSVSATGGKINIQDNKLITQTAAGTWNGASYDGVTGMIASGRNGNAWNGNGIVTTQTLAVGSNYTSIGVAKASDVRPATATATDLWAGQTITGTDTLVMYTYGGDATLDGKINIDDYVKIDSGIAAGLTGWVNGDFNYDGKVSIDDYITVIDANIGNQNGIFPTAAGLGSPSGVSAVPEPAGLSLVMLGAVAMVGRRRRRSDRRSVVC